MDIIIGAGATGLAYAAMSPNKCLILEADNQVGGYCKTIKQDGFVWDYSGHFFHFRNKDMEDFICRCMTDTPLVCKKHTQIKYGNDYIDFPFQKNIHQLPKEEFIECLYDLFNNEFKSFGNFKEMLYCKFGKSIAEKFLIPYNEKLYAVDLNNLDCDAMGRFFPYADKEEIIKNFVASKNTSYNDTFTYPRGGAIEYINSLVAQVGNNTEISLGERVIAIDAAAKTVTTNKRTLTYDNLISTIPFPKLLELIGADYDPNIYSWNKVLVFNMGFDSKGADTKNNWVYFPDRELSFYRIGYYDNIFNTDRMSLYVELGFPKDADIDVDYWRQRVLADLKKAGIIADGQHLISSHNVIMDPAYVHITPASIADVKEWKEKLANKNIYSIGRYGSWTYCSIEDGMIEAKNLVECVK